MPLKVFVKLDLHGRWRYKILLWELSIAVTKVRDGTEFAKGGEEEVKTVEVIKENLKPWASAIIAVFAFVIVGCASLGFMIRKKEL